eukprot:GHUV01032368.1.p1 GENE.GHUV01032368.1~~GHUV01032368.1.p1  ORF type:complete len:177 (+),score=49.03 GHUV01032368.1:482-1012(+)
MAEDAVDTALATGKLPVTQPCRTSRLKLLGGQAYNPTLHTEVAQQASTLLPSTAACSPATARHLASAYGDQAHEVLELAADEHLAGLLVPGHPYIEAEVVHACRSEYCASVEDFLARRTRLAFLDSKAAEAAIPRVASLMAKELGWTRWRERSEIKNAGAYLATFAVPAHHVVAAA